MGFRKSYVFGGIIGLVIVLTGTAWGQLERVSVFKGVEFPFDFKSGETIIQKGRYDLEVCYSKSDTSFLYFLRLMRSGKYLYEIPGERIEYPALTIQDLMKDPKIPNGPTIRIKKIPESNLINIIFESGKTGNMPFEKAFFRVEEVKK